MSLNRLTEFLKIIKIQFAFVRKIVSSEILLISERELISSKHVACNKLQVDRSEDSLREKTVFRFTATLQIVS